MNSGELKRAKRHVRAEVLARRDAIAPEDRAVWGAAIASRFVELPEVRAAATVMVFWSFGSEVPTDGLIEHLLTAGTDVGVPRLVGDDLEVVTWRPGDAVRPTTFGAMEPVDGDVLAPAAIDVVAVPGVAFDRSGRRIGYGGGFYDRFLVRTRPDTFRAAPAFSSQVAEGDLPAGGFDLPVHAIVTQTQTLRVEPPFNSAV